MKKIMVLLLSVAAAVNVMAVDYTAKAKVTLTNSKKKALSNKYAKTFRYASSNKNVATVSSKGKITAKNKGTCYIFVYARNGYTKKVKVTVK